VGAETAAAIRQKENRASVGSASVARNNVGGSPSFQAKLDAREGFASRRAKPLSLFCNQLQIVSSARLSRTTAFIAMLGMLRQRGFMNL